MGQDRGSWFPPQRLNSLSPPLNSSFVVSHSGHQDASLVSKNFAANMVTVRGSCPVYAKLPLTHVGGGNESHGLVCGLLPNLRSRFAPPQKPCMKQISSAGLFRDQTEAVMPKAGDDCTPKRFLVFDQSGDQTTLIFSSGVGKPFEGLTSGTQHPDTHDMKRGLLRTNGDLVVHQGIISREEFAENSEPDVQSEMHEDTEELNALLYSDDESDYSDEDEVTSSGHSPSTISAHCNEEGSVGSTDGTSASAGHLPTKKRKLPDGCDYVTLTMPLDRTNSPKRNRLCLGDDNDAESSCASCGNEGSVERSLPSSNKRIGKEKISETLSLLRSIVPGGDVEDPFFVIDKAIDYLKFLKMKAETLGLESLGSLEA